MFHNFFVPTKLVIFINKDKLNILRLLLTVKIFILIIFDRSIVNGIVGDQTKWL